MTQSAAILILMTLAAGAAEAQRRAPAQAANATVPATINLRAGTKVYNFSGAARCTHAAVASIYGVRAERWSMERTGDSLDATFALWRPASGADMISLTFQIDTTQYSINTIKVGSNGTVQGSGTATFAREGTGGTFTLKGAAANGTPIDGTIKCSAFTPAVAEGGD